MKKYYFARIILLILLIALGVFFGNALPKIKNAKAAPCILNSSGNNCENQDAVIDGTTVTISGQHSFNSLTIKNSGVLTHDALIPETDFDTTNYTLNSTGENKKIDLTIANDLTLESNGQVYADGKGYPGGYAVPNSGGYWHNLGHYTGFGVFNGFGNGGATSIYSLGFEHSGAGGASYRGKGGDGSGVNGNNNAPVGFNYGNNLSFYPGSGGGAALSWDDGELSCRSWGGAGGGRIKIVTNSVKFNSTFSTISANGKAGVFNSAAGCEASAGGGSGGTVWIESNELYYPAPVSPNFNIINVGVNINEVPIIPEYGYYPTPNNLVNGEINITLSGYNANSVYNINSMGGMASLQGNLGHAIGGVGGGGLVIIMPRILPPPAISSKMITVTVTWPEGARTEKVELKSLLKDISN